MIWYNIPIGCDLLKHLFVKSEFSARRTRSKTHFHFLSSKHFLFLVCIVWLKTLRVKEDSGIDLFSPMNLLQSRLGATFGQIGRDPLCLGNFFVSDLLIRLCDRIHIKATTQTFTTVFLQILSGPFTVWQMTASLYDTRSIDARGEKGLQPSCLTVLTFWHRSFSSSVGVLWTTVTTSTVDIINVIPADSKVEESNLVLIYNTYQ